MKIKLAVGVTLFFFIHGFVLAQSLAELARKERERRESLGSKKSIIITNEDLAKVKRKPALETGPPATETGNKDIATLGQRTSEDETATTSFSQTGSPIITESSAPLPNLDLGSRAGERKQLEEAYQKAKEYVELLTLKLNALWQEFYSLDDMTPRDLIQQAIAETYLKLQKAQQEEENLRQQLEKILSTQKKDIIPSIWIR